MKKNLFILISYLIMRSAFGVLSVENGTVSNITATNAALSVNLVSTNSTNAAVTVYYGTAAGGTNAAFWQYSNYFGAVSTGVHSFVTTNLSPRSYYYFCAYASETTNTDWTGMSNFTTLSRVVTNWPTLTNDITQMVDTNGNWKTPSKSKVIAANGLAATNDLSEHTTNTIVHVLASDKTNWNGKATLADVAAAGYLTNAVQSEVDPIWAGASNTVVYTNDTRLTDARTPTAHDQGYLTITNAPWISDYTETDSIATNMITTASNHFESAKLNTSATNGWETGSHASLLTTNGNAIGLTNFPASVVLTNNAKLLAAITNESYLGTITGATIADGAASSVTTNGGRLDFIIKTNAVSGSGSGFPLTNNVNLAGFAMSNGAFIGNGAGLTNLSGIPSTNQCVLTNNATFMLIETNSMSWTALDGIQFYVTGTNVAISNSYSDVAILAATNALNTRAGNLETATNALNTLANAALPSSWTNNMTGNGAGFTNISGQLTTAEKILATNSVQTGGAASVASLQITGGSPTDGAVWIATNALGQGALKVLSKFSVYASTAQNLPGSFTKVAWAATNFNIGNTFANNQWTPGRECYVFITAYISYVADNASTRHMLSIYRDGVENKRTDQNWSSALPITIPVSGIFYCPTATNVFDVRAYNSPANTNQNTSMDSIFSGSELP